jgi:hypothetical protein
MIIHGPSSVTINPETEELEAVPVPAMRSSSVFLGLANVTLGSISTTATFVSQFPSPFRLLLKLPNFILGPFHNIA